MTKKADKVQETKKQEVVKNPQEVLKEQYDNAPKELKEHIQSLEKERGELLQKVQAYRIVNKDLK